MTDDNNKPFKLYRASAGSGKTYTLVKEFITLCPYAMEISTIAHAAPRCYNAPKERGMTHGTDTSGIGGSDGHQ